MNTEHQNTEMSHEVVEEVIETLITDTLTSDTLTIIETETVIENLSDDEFLFNAGMMPPKSCGFCNNL